MAVVIVWSHKPDGGYSGLSGGDPVDYWVADLDRYGHSITEAGPRPVNHHVIGYGVCHDDALFAEAGRSMAAYYENESERGRWWEDDSRYSPKRYYTGEWS